MSLILPDSRSFKLGDLHLDILSVGGHYTCVQFPHYKIAIDMGICPQTALKASTVFFTHPHTDHMSGVIYHLSTREMISAGRKNTYVVGEEHLHGFTRMIESWRSLCKNDLNCEVVSLPIGQKYKLRENLWMESFRSVHRIPCQGYMLARQKKKIKASYKEYTGPALAAARKRGEEISNIVVENLCAFTGDSSHHVFAQQPSILKSKVLITEVTFFCDRITPKKATHQGHMHIQDLLRYESMFQNEHIVIMHLSARYSIQEVEKAVRKILPKHLSDRCVLVPNELLF